ncbi:BQ5605_C008g05382 [Microbotryum silenes-dioicae]|uniref:BQ5605_C008g05382 protein n=1 Tax=Microbotryum silenes-dioicae TaxID=796604 RepID=A0A2X0MGB4_9BASI|nr:BQ5605_C008g05382 [Microbotryum silenes-dioicae]
MFGKYTPDSGFNETAFKRVESLGSSTQQVLQGLDGVSAFKRACKTCCVLEPSDSTRLNAVLLKPEFGVYAQLNTLENPDES